MGRRRKMKIDGICPHCNIEMSYENGEYDSYRTDYWWQCKSCGRSYDQDTKEDITEYDCMDIN